MHNNTARSLAAALCLTVFTVCPLLAGKPEIINSQQTGTDYAELPNFNLTPDEMTKIHDDALAKVNSALDTVAKIADKERSFKNTVAAVETAFAKFNTATWPVTFLAQVSTDKTVRNRAEEIALKKSDEMVELSTREDIYKAVKAYTNKHEKLAPKDKKLLDDQLVNFRRYGLELPGAKQAEFKTLLKRIAELQIKLSTNIKDNPAVVMLKITDLKGLPADFMKDLKPNDKGEVEIRLDYPHYTTIMENADNPAVRAATEFKFNNTAADINLPLLKEVLEKRRAVAAMLGYPSYAHFVLDYRRIAKNPEEVVSFLNRLKTLLAAGAKADLSALLELKKKNIPEATSIDNSDITGLIGQQIGYYPAKYMKEKYTVNSDEIREYFPVERVIRETLSLFQEMYGITFREIPTRVKPDTNGPANTWYPEVKLFEIRDTKSNRLLSHFYLDLYPREGKFGHMGCFDIIPGHRQENGTYVLPVAAMLGNFTKSMAGKPALMSHEEVVTFFHEFGHIMHQTLTRASYASFSGLHVAHEFLEAPSTMQENFAWTPEVLNRISGSYKDETKKLPAELLNKMLAARNALASLQRLRIVALSMLDMRFHDGTPAEDLSKITSEVFTETGYLKPTPGTHFEERFGHIMGKYAGGYYGYLWSAVYAQDIFSRFAENGVISPKIGMLYRKTILERGSSVDEAVSLREFLQREPSEKAFIKSLGL